MGDVGFLNLCTVLFTVIKNNPRRLAMATTMFNIVRLVMLDELCEDVIDTLFNALLSVIGGNLLKELLTLSAFQTTVGAYRFDRCLQIVLRLTDSLCARFAIDAKQDTQPVRDTLAMVFTPSNTVQRTSYFPMTRVVHVARHISPGFIDFRAHRVARQNPQPCPRRLPERRLRWDLRIDGELELESAVIPLVTDTTAALATTDPLLAFRLAAEIALAMSVAGIGQ